ncbi:hypothetical protein I317_03567 [Kwoniella heveanensis CBS 569]|nr:hypothetical protein I317_03567 [Kwoniella heveanensis CBS 569]
MTPRTRTADLPTPRGSSPNPNPLGGFQTPPFRPSSSSASSSSSLTSLGHSPVPFDLSSSERWISPLHVDCHFPLSVFLSTMKGLALHPERNTTFILRADQLHMPPTEPANDRSSISGLDLVEEIKLRLLPRQPRRDGKLDQMCLFYRSKEDGHLSKGKGKEREQDKHMPGEAAQHEVNGENKGGKSESGLKLGSEKGLVVMIPLVKDRNEIPYFHPPVRKIAFYYQSILQDDHASAPTGDSTCTENQDEEAAALQENSEVNEETAERIRGRISIHYLPFEVSTTDSERLTSEDDLHATALDGSPLGARRTSVGVVPKRSSPLAGPSINRGLSGSAEGAANQPLIVGGRNKTRSQASKHSPVTASPSQTHQLPSTADTTARISSLSFLPKHLSTPGPPSPVTAEPNDGSKGGTKPSSQAKTEVRSPPTPDDRLYRTCLGLLERVYKHGYGQLVGYQKRRVHDVIVARDNFQDLYLVLKDRHKHLDSRASRPGMMSTKLEDNTSLPLVSTDDPTLPSSNTMDVSEWGQQDVAIAAFLMLLWKEMYPPRERARPLPVASDGVGPIAEPDEERERDTWGRPEGGFIDLGCGNGLLVHILISEGYDGKGYELRSRRTWPSYPVKTQDALVELPIDPSSWFPATIEDWESGTWTGKEDCVIKEKTFLIGNHSDELTPWLPLLSLIPNEPIPHLSLPCCLHTLDSAFDILQYVAPDHPQTPEGGFENGLEPGVSRYKSYLMWLGYCGLKAGWKWEKEGLRVPSTKGWGIVARKRWTTGAEDDRECRMWALEQVNQVKARGAFKVREKEGKEH